MPVFHETMRDTSILASPFCFSTINELRQFSQSFKIRLALK